MSWPDPATDGTGLLVIDGATVFAAVSPTRAIACAREAFVRHAEGSWEMAPKVYLDAAPNGDFRAMAAKGDGLAILKWIASFPANPGKGLPLALGMICVSRLDTAEPLAVIDARAVTALRTGAVAALAAMTLARDGACSVGVIGCGVHGAWAARCLAAAGYGPGTCHDVDQPAAAALAEELGWHSGTREDALGCDIVTCVTPGARPVIHATDLRPGMHLSLLGADGPGKSEADLSVIERCALFCDDWHQASNGGELTSPRRAGRLARANVTELGDVLTERCRGRTEDGQITLFDSTGLAIQDLALYHAMLTDEHRDVPVRPIIHL